MVISVFSMTRYFWNIFTRKNGTEALHDIEVIVRDFGYIVDYKKFAEDYRILQIEVESGKIGGFFSRLSAVFNVERYNEITLRPSSDDEVFLNIRILEG